MMTLSIGSLMAWSTTACRFTTMSAAATAPSSSCDGAERVASFATAMAIIVDPDNWPLLWHCSAGKDRAGWIGTSVLLAADASTEVIVDHYLQSNQMIGAGALFPKGELKDLIRPFLEVHEDYVRAQLVVNAATSAHQ